jgi:anti-sigma-K factor RskA
MTHDDARDILPLQALGVLDGAEREALEAHLAECASCRDALADEVRVVDALAYVPDQVRPRPELKARVLEVARTKGHVLEFKAPPVAPVAIPPATGAALKASPWPWLVAAAAAAVAVASTVGLVRARAELADLRADIVAVEAQLAEADQRTVRATAEVRVQQQALDVLASPDLVRATLDGLPPAANARAQALLSPSRGTLVLSATGLPAPPAGRTYQLWAIVGSQAVSAGVFTPDADGLSRVIATVAFNGPPVALAVTLEPEGGVPQPTGPKYLLGVPAN